MSIQLNDVSVETALRYILKSVDLGFVKQDGVLVVTAKDKTMVRRVYQVGTLVGDNEERNVAALITAIVRTVEPGTWWFPANQKMFNPFQGGAAQPNGGAALGGAGGNQFGNVGGAGALGSGGMFGMMGSGPPTPISEGGPADIQLAGTVAYFPATKALVIRHYHEVHREIEELLANLAEK